VSGGVSDLHLIDLDQELPGQRRFISCWARVGGDVAYVVDPGPPSTADRLVAGLEQRGLDRLDFILLTHVHLDHGGCTARILDRWPAARVICHEKGRPHLVDPSRLWDGSRQVLGRKAEVYGEPTAVPEGAIGDFGEAAARGIVTIDTPGHAPHHVSFQHGDDLFLGEAAGTFSTLGRGADTPEPYLRPATPPRFFPEVARASLDRLLALDPFPAHLRFAHHGAYAGDGRALLATARAQLDLWLDACRRVLAAFRALPHTEQGEDALFDAIADELVRVDPHFARGRELPDDIRERERDYTRQTLRGMLGHLADVGFSGD
jgi:glyoxylase-like metal-dependent hydrolase (beta-lactamase superfamily II)